MNEAEDLWFEINHRKPISDSLIEVILYEEYHPSKCRYVQGYFKEIGTANIYSVNQIKCWRYIEKVPPTGYTFDSEYMSYG